MDQNQLKKLATIAWNFYKDTISNRDDKKIKQLDHIKTKEILNKDQYEKYLSLLVTGKAHQRTQKVWKEMKQLQVASNLDSIATVHQMLPYFIEKYKIEERYSIIPGGVKNKESQTALLRSNRPWVLKNMDSELKRLKKDTSSNINALTW